jgi:hypothetical protein
MFMSPGMQFSSDVQFLFAHEAFHTWNPVQLGAVTPKDPIYWFTEGFTDYYARMLLLRASLMNKQQYADAYSPILFAQGAILAGIVADRVLYRGETLQSFKFQIAGFIVFFVIIVLGPLLMFTPRMARVRRRGLADYGLFAQRYVEDFERKWVRGPFASEELLGTGDVQSLADLANSYDVVREMRVVPFTLQDLSRLALATATPLTPLLLTVFSPEELFMRVIKVVF